MTFLAITLWTVAGAMGAVLLRNLLHCALCLAASLIGTAAFFLHLNAQFAGFAQILVYVGAVAVLILFAILLTSGGMRDPKESVFSDSWTAGGVVAGLLLAVMVWSITSSKLLSGAAPLVREITVREIGDQLMTRYVLALEVVGLLLTAALIGAVLLAARDTRPKGDQ